LCGSSSTTPPRAGLSSTTLPTPCDWVPRDVARLVVDYFAYVACSGASARRAARCRLFRLRHASSCLGLSRGSSSTTLLAPHVRVPRHVARLVTRLVVDYSMRRDFILRPHWLYFEYAACRRDIVFRSHRVDHSSRLVFQTSRERQSRPQQLVGINSDWSTSATNVVAPSPTATASSIVYPGSNS
jgi:hypothetical protein